MFTSSWSDHVWMAMSGHSNQVLEYIWHVELRPLRHWICSQLALRLSMNEQYLIDLICNLTTALKSCRTVALSMFSFTAFTIKYISPPLLKALVKYHSLSWFSPNLFALQESSNRIQPPWLYWAFADCPLRAPLAEAHKYLPHWIWVRLDSKQLLVHVFNANSNLQRQIYRRCRWEEKILASPLIYSAPNVISTLALHKKNPLKVIAVPCPGLVGHWQVELDSESRE